MRDYAVFVVEEGVDTMLGPELHEAWSDGYVPVNEALAAAALEELEREVGLKEGELALAQREVARLEAENSQRGGGGARTLRGGGQSLSIIGFLTTRSLLTEKLGLTDRFVGCLLRPRGFLRELRHGQRMGGDIGRGIDAEQEIAGLHLGAFGVIDRLQDTRHAGADFHLAHAFGLRRRNRRLGDVRQSHRQDRHRQWPGRRHGRLLATTEQAEHQDRTEKTLDRARFTYRHVCKSICPTMARKTKAEAALTRDRIVTCARQVFSREGVTNTSLETVAKEAGVTRGAVYWHFRDKADLFMAVRQQTGTLLRFDDFRTGDALERLESGLQAALDRLRTDQQALETYEVMLWKCEYVGAFAGVRKDLMSASSLFLTEVTELYDEAVRMKQAPANLDPALAARETLCFYAGLLKLWLADENGVTVRAEVRQLIAQHVARRRLQKAV